MTMRSWKCLILLILCCISNFMPSETAAANRESGKTHPGYFYIYDWPEFMYDVWPPMNSTLVKDSPYSHGFRGNNGAGVAIDPSMGYYMTWQFSMFQMIMARMRVSEYRTMDPEKANAFIIPFDIGAHSFIDHENGRARVAAPHGWRAIEWLKESAPPNSVFWKNHGHDHFLFFSITSYQIIGIGGKVFMTQKCQNCSVMTIETTPSFTARKYYSGKSKKWWWAVPYPSSFHWTEGITDIPWKRQTEARPYISIFIGSLITSTPASNKLRTRMQNHCKADDKGDCLWFDAAHSCSGLVNQTDNLLLYRKSTFCLAPPGDSLTRKSLFDSFTCGCIPVVFAKATINQYLWHIPEEDVEKISVYIPGQTILEQGVNFLQVLRAISPAKIKAMQTRIEELAPSLQYSVVPDGYGPSALASLDAARLSRYGFDKKKLASEKGGGHHSKSSPPGSGSSSSLSSSSSSSSSSLLGEKGFDFNYKGKHWKPPFRDAVDVIIERILNRTTIEPLEGFTDEQRARYEYLRDHYETVDPSYAGFLPAETSPNGNAKVSPKKGGKKWNKMEKASAPLPAATSTTATTTTTTSASASTSTVEKTASSDISQPSASASASLDSAPVKKRASKSKPLFSGA